MLLFRKLSVGSLCFLLIVILFAGLLTTLYISKEHIFYWWDYAFYQKIACDTGRLFLQNPLQALMEVHLSTWLDYNYYFALPLIPFMELFKCSRLGYILSLIFIYHIPLLIVSGHIAKRIFPSLPYAGWVTIFTGTLIPVLWASVFRGFPDTGAVLLIALAIVIYLRDMELKKWRFQLPAIGVLCGFAIIFRRHFTYNVVSFLFSIGITLIFFAIQHSKKNWKDFLLEISNVLIKMLIILASLVISIVVLAPGLLLNIIHINYLDLYSSYSLDSSQVFGYFLKAYGILWFLVVSGFLSVIPKAQKFLRLENSNADRKPLYFILFFGMISIVTWTAIPRQIGTQYVLHIALPVILGSSVLIMQVFAKPKLHSHWLIISSISLVFGFNFWAGLAPEHLVPIPTTLNYPPLYRPDYNEVVRLISYLREITGDRQNIYVVDSSTLMNDQIIHYADVFLSNKNTSFLHILYSPQIDSRDTYPLESLLQADYIVMTTPFQYHIENEQKVVKFVFDVFTQQLKISKDFQKLPEEFHLSDGAVLSVYKRQAPTSLETTLLTFDQMRKYIGLLPGRQSDWILITPSIGATLMHDTGGKEHSIEMANHTALSFLYVGKDPIQYLITGKVKFSEEKCPPIDISIKVFSLSEPIAILYEKQITTDTGEFTLSIERADNTALVLSYQQSAISFAQLCNPILEWELTN